MAVPSSYVPAPVTPSLPKQRFTLNQANRALPLVSRIVRDIVAMHSTISEQQGQQSRKSNKSTKAPTAETSDVMKRSLDKLQMYLDELTTLGVELKDFDSGLVDFVGRHKGRDVYLCWKLNEPRIEYWHELDAGFSGRQPVASLDEIE